MVVASLTIGGVVGVLLSGAFLWWEVGRFASPQVPVTRFDERKVLAAYTVGLFAGVPFAVAYVLLLASMANGALPGALLFLVALVAGTELAQVFVTRSQYWGAGVALPFYLVSFRAGIGGILALTAVAAYLGGVAHPQAAGTAAALLSAVALVAVEVAGALLSRREPRPIASRTGGPLAGGIFGGVAFFLLGLGPLTGAAGAIAAPLVVTAGAVLAYRGRRVLLEAVPAPGTGTPPSTPADRPLPYGRTDARPTTPPADDGRPPA